MRIDIQPINWNKKSLILSCFIYSITLSDGLAHHESLYGKRLLVLLRVGEETSTLDRTLLSQVISM